MKIKITSLEMVDCGEPRREDFSEAGGYVRQHIAECWHEDDNGHMVFDWDEYQALCDQADYWDEEG